MNIDLTVERKIVLSVEDLSALRLMLRVDMAYKSQIAMASAIKGVLKESLKVTREREKLDYLTDKDCNAIGDQCAQNLLPTVSDFLDDFISLERPLVRGMELMGISEANALAKADTKIAVFVSAPDLEKIKACVLTGYYNAVRTVSNDGATDQGAVLGSTLLKSRPAIIEAISMAEVPAQDVASGILTFTQPVPKGALLN